jgi:hypothetical protein
MDPLKSIKAHIVKVNPFYPSPMDPLEITAATRWSDTGHHSQTL